MKNSKKLLIAALIIAISSVVVIAQTENRETVCCLCSSFRYHAPCLLDLESGELIELALYDPHAVKVAELAEKQQQVDTFSLISFGSVKGTRLTGSRIIEIKVPSTDTALPLSLCKDCQKILQDDYSNRYVLADLYDADIKHLIPIVDGTQITLRCYDISMKETLQNGEILVTIQGSLDILSED